MIDRSSWESFGGRTTRIEDSRLSSIASGRMLSRTTRIEDSRLSSIASGRMLSRTTRMTFCHPPMYASLILKHTFFHNLVLNHASALSLGRCVPTETNASVDGLISVWSVDLRRAKAWSVDLRRAKAWSVDLRRAKAWSVDLRRAKAWCVGWCLGDRWRVGWRLGDRWRSLPFTHPPLSLWLRF